MYVVCNKQHKDFINIGGLQASTVREGVVRSFLTGADRSTRIGLNNAAVFQNLDKASFRATV